ncbi:MAG: hypothetical protein UIH41_03710 [Treponemataceae bacterium]|nr:hypothetical protein [Treponemataceae bacterium]
MHKDFSALNKLMQDNLKKQTTFSDGIKNLLQLRNNLMEEIDLIFKTTSPEDFFALPFPKSKGNTNATIAWSIYHIFRIEDIVCNSVINSKTQIFFEYDFQNSMNSSIITTGNELSNEEMIEFSKKLNIQELYKYAKLVKETSEKMILEISYEETKLKIPEEKKEYLKSLKVVSLAESSSWLIDYWCGKNVRGLLQMPFSRHWIMHVEACLKIKNKLEKIRAF